MKLKLSEKLRLKIEETKTHHTSKTGLSLMVYDAESMEASLSPVDKECLCEWPDGTIRKVMVLSVDDGKAKVIWNERHAFIEGNGCMVGLDDNVPLAWLYIPANDQMRDGR